MLTYFHFIKRFGGFAAFTDFDRVVDAEINEETKRSIMKYLKNKGRGIGWAASLLISVIGMTCEVGGQTAPSGGGVSLRIVGGSIANAVDYPWMVGLVSGDESDLTNAQFCGASVIAPTWVITAAHCVENEIPGNVDVIIGAGDLRDSSAFRRIRVSRIITHAGYFNQEDGIDADIALLELTESVEGGAVLPVIEDEALAVPGTMSRTIGWGLTSEGGSPAAELREVDLPIVSLETANATGAYDMELTADMLPAGFPGGGKDSCNGDSGGPLLVRNQANDGDVLAGIVSFGSHLGCAAPNAYGIYTRVSYFLDWIQRGMAGELEVTESGSEGNRPDDEGEFDPFDELTDEWPPIPGEEGEFDPSDELTDEWPPVPGQEGEFDPFDELTDEWPPIPGQEGEFDPFDELADEWPPVPGQEGEFDPFDELTDEWPPIPGQEGEFDPFDELTGEWPPIPGQEGEFNPSDELTDEWPPVPGGDMGFPDWDEAFPGFAWPDDEINESLPGDDEGFEDFLPWEDILGDGDDWEWADDVEFDEDPEAGFQEFSEDWEAHEFEPGEFNDDEELFMDDPLWDEIWDLIGGFDDPWGNGEGDFWGDDEGDFWEDDEGDFWEDDEGEADWDSDQMWNGFFWWN